MNIEAGDYFVISRGSQLNTRSLASIFSDGTEDWKGDGEKLPQYDRSYVGDVLLALEVCGPVIAAKWVYVSNSVCRKAGESFLVNTEDVTVWPVTPAFVKALGVKVPK